jgi:hypothetical protein
MPNVQARFSANPQKPVLGSSFHQQADGQVPVCFITDIKNKILIQHKPTETSEWVVSRSRINITRLWACSTAFIKCVCAIPDNDVPTPPLTNTPVFRPKPQQRDSSDIISEDASTPYPLGIGDEICVYFGYLNNISEDIKKEDIGAKFRRVFIGGIDTITEASNFNEGVTIAIECRDRMKYLMDSISNYNPADTSKPQLAESERSKARSQVILEIARSAVGDFTESTSCTTNGCGYKILQHTDSGENYTDIDYFYTPSAVGSLAVKDGSKKQLPVSIMPTFYIQSTRQDYGEQDQVSFHMVVDRLPIDYLKYMSLQEVYYTEVFAHNVTGDYYYSARFVSTEGLGNPKLLYRTYFNRITPPGLGKLYNKDNSIDNLHPSQIAIAYQEENSLISWRSNVIIKNDGTGQNPSSNFLHVKSTPVRFEKRGFPCSYVFITDSTLNKPAEYAATAIAYIRRVGKPVRAAELHLLGDPSLSPGELIQVIGSMPKNTTTPQDQKTLLEESFKQRQNAMSYANLYKQEIKDIVSAIDRDVSVTESSSSESTPVSVHGIKKTGDLTVQSLTEGTNIYCSAITDSATTDPSSENSDDPGSTPEPNPSSATSESSNIADITVLEDIDSMWRIENVQHQFNDGKPGFYSILALTNPY